jgi:hypothetical protein
MAGINEFTDSEIATKSYDWLREARENDTEWREFSKKSQDYYLGRQWDRADESRMRDTKRAALTVNQIRSLIKLVTGYQRQNRYPIRIYGNEQSDEPTAALLEELVQNIIVNQLYQYQDSQRFLHGIVTGRGYMFGKMDYSDDWMGQVKLHSRINPRHVYFDPLSKDITLADAEYITWVELIRESNLRALIGDEEIAKYKVAELQHLDWESDFDPEDWPVAGSGKYFAGAPGDRWWGRKGGVIPTGAFYKVQNVFYRTWVDDFILTDRQTGQSYPVESRKQGQEIIKQRPNDLLMVQRRVQRIKSALVCGNQVFDHKDSATGHKIFPIIPYFGGYYLGRTFGLVEDLTDIQDFVNKRFSNYAHILNTTANPGWIGDEDAVEDWMTFEREASKPAPVIKKRKGSSLERLDSGSIPGAETRGMTDGTELIKIVSGINPDMVGQSDKDTSGRAIMLRQQQGYQILAENVDNHRLAQTQTAQWMVDAIQNNYTYEKTFRIIMPNNQVKYATLNQRVTDMMGAVENVLNDVTIGDYDVIVSDQAVSPSLKYLHFQELIEIVRETGVGIPPEVLVKASNLPEDMKREIVEAMANAMQGIPPGMDGQTPGQPPAPQGGTPAPPDIPDEAGGV